jgi:ATP-dependent Clp protease ATP-binding subunit ClpC
MADNTLANRLTTGAQRIVQAALQLQIEKNHPALGVNHWLLVLLDRHAPMLLDIAPQLDVEKTRTALTASLQKNETGMLLDQYKVVEEAETRAHARGKMQAAEKDIATVVLKAAGLVGGAAENISPAPDIEKADTSNIPVEPANEKPADSTPVLDQFGHDLTRAARENRLVPILGRDDEIQLVIETLLRRSKRNPVLVGPAGVGKTAIVEGLAQRVAQGSVPDSIKGVRIVALQPSNLVAGASMSGDLEKRMQNIIKEASQEGIILFIDEIHSVMGSGGLMGSSDIASILKPSLARGEVAVIAATTDDEYRRFIETDSALERRFQPIRINELSPEYTFQVLVSLRGVLQKKYPLAVEDGILAWLVDFAQHYMHNRHFPDKGVDLLEQCYAHAAAKGKSSLDLSDAEEVAQRMIGMPVALDQRLAALQTQLSERGLLSEESIHKLINRLQVTLRGLDIHSNRPNAVLLLCGETAQNHELLSRTIAAALFGGSDRVVSIDLARFTHPADVNLLVGSPPGYVGYSESLPIHRLMQIPWAVLELINMDACYPSIREVIVQALENGFLVDGRGKSIYLSDSVVILTAAVDLITHRSLGFRAEEQINSSGAVHDAIVDAVGSGIAGQVDLFVTGIERPSEISLKSIENDLLASILEKYQKQGLDLIWDASLIEWLVDRQKKNVSERDWEQWVDNSLSPAIIPFLPKPGMNNRTTLLIKIEGQDIQIINQ